MRGILVTGSSGYIGRRLAKRLKQEGHRVVGVDRVPASADSGLDEFIEADLLDVDRYAHILPSVDQVCHLAAAKGDWGISEADYYRDNVEATRSLLDAARDAGVKSWIFYSTVSVLGPSDSPLEETAPHAPANPYGASKAECEKLFNEHCQAISGARVSFIRPSVVFGPENPWNTNIYRLIDAVSRSRFVMIRAGGALKSTSYIDNLIAAHMFVMEKNLAESRAGVEVYQYVDDPVWSTARLVEHIRRRLQKSATGVRVPLWLAAPLALIADAAAAVLRVDLPITSARIRKFCTSTNFSANKIRGMGFVQPVSMEDALDKTIDWYLKTGSS
jgi:nucleoside-diphosphate-sugar epimerase